MGNTDKRDRISEDVFGYRVSKEGKVFISWQGRQVMTLRGKQAQKFLAKVTNADRRTAQLVMAKTTGNFKRGNERKQTG